MQTKFLKIHSYGKEESETLVHIIQCLKGANYPLALIEVNVYTDCDDVYINFISGNIWRLKHNGWYNNEGIKYPYCKLWERFIELFYQVEFCEIILRIPEED